MDSTIAGVVHAVKHMSGDHIRMIEDHLKGHPNRLPDAPFVCPDCGSPPRDTIEIKTALDDLTQGGDLTVAPAPPTAKPKKGAK